MKLVLQRVKGLTEITIERAGQEPSIESFNGVGLVALLAWTEEDAKRDDLDLAEEWMLSRVASVRIFPDDKARMNESLKDYAEANKNVDEAGILWVPQFTLAGEMKSGFRPSFMKAMEPRMASIRFAAWKKKAEAKTNELGIKSIFGDFGADMLLDFKNWGPVTLLLER